MKKCHAKKFFFFWLNNCFSNLAILYGLCILDIKNYAHNQTGLICVGNTNIDKDDNLNRQTYFALVNIWSSFVICVNI